MVISHTIGITILTTKQVVSSIALGYNTSKLSHLPNMGAMVTKVFIEDIQNTTHRNCFTQS